MRTVFLKSTIILGFIFFYSCGGPSDTSSDKLNFEQVGYYKGDNKLRYFTFWVESDTIMNPVAIPSEFLKEIKAHGAKQMNTAGQITASFYYLDKKQVPDITTLDAQAANDLAHEQRPITSVWIMPNGQINLIENPE